jgi:hypothetical protein
MTSSVVIEELKDEVSPPKTKKQECTLGALYVAFEALSTLASEKLDPKASAKILKLANWIEPLYNDIVEIRNKEAGRLGEPVEDGKVRIPADNVEEFNTTMRAATSETVKVPASMKLTIGDLDGAKVSPAVLLSISCVMVGLL